MGRQGRRIVGGRARWGAGLVALIATFTIVAACSAAASAAPIRWDRAPKLITSPQGGYGTVPSSPGPTVSVNVPNLGGGKGFIEVWAKVRANVNETAVGLFDVTGGHRQFVSGQDTLCSTTTNVPIPGVLFLTLDGVPGVYGTPMSAGFTGCAPTVGAPGSVLLKVPSGVRTFRLEYADCGCGGTAKVSDRWLWIRRVPPS
jgi:hypothetical protein